MRISYARVLVLVAVGILLGAASSASGGLETDNQGSEAALLSNIRQLTFEGKRAGEGYFSADGSRLVFQSERDPENPFFQIFLMDLETGDTSRISPGTGKTTCAWVHPEGRRVLFASTHEDPDAVRKQKEELEARASGTARRYSWDYDEFYELYQADLASGELHRLTRAKGYDAEGSWSPDGRFIAFASNRHAYDLPLSDKEKEVFEIDKSYFLDIYIMDSDGTNVRRLTDVPGYDGGPFFSADGSRICWRRFSEDGATAEIFTMNLDGTGQKQLTHLGAMSWAPYFHPSGDYLIFATNKHGFSNFELYLVDSRGQQEPVRVTYTEGFDGLPAFSPDGSRLAWTSNRTASSQSQIFFADWNDSTARELLGIRRQLDTDPAISRDDLRKHVEFLASDATEGRMTGSPGAAEAAKYAVSIFRALGLAPAGDDGTFYQAFEFTSGVSLGDSNSLQGESPQGKESWKVDEDWRPLAFSRTGPIESSAVVYAGYGIVAPPEESQTAYDSYVHLDVQDKWVLAFRFLPENISPERRQHLARYSGIRYKAMAARERGARGILFVSGPNSQVENQVIPLSYDSSSATTSLGVLSISDGLAQSLLNSSGRSLKELQDELDGGEISMGFALSGVNLSAGIDIRHEKKTDYNLLARLESGASPDTPAVVVGAHYDHLGRGKGMSTLATEDEKGQIHYGADDNASGVSGLLEMAEYLAHQLRDGRVQLERDLIFALWSGEELGLLGSNSFAGQLAQSIGNEADISSRVAAYLNMDMIGRLRKDLILQGIGSSSIWPSEIERRNAPVGLSIVTQNDSYLPTDATSFYLKRVPILSAFTGTHAEYHSPRDTADTLNYEGMEQVVRFLSLVARSLAANREVPDYQEMKRPVEGGGRANLRAYLGTIPDYAGSDVVGMKLSGVIGGGPAEKAGLQGGDIIVELAGRKIENIYDYTYAIEALKIGQEVEVVILRNNERLARKITPGSRQ